MRTLNKLTPLDHLRVAATCPGSIQAEIQSMGLHPNDTLCADHHAWCLDAFPSPPSQCDDHTHLHQWQQLSLVLQIESQAMGVQVVHFVAGNLWRCSKQRQYDT